ncbi:MAG: IS1380 family transposase [Candidatus Cloacimonadota bacterium]|nr:IS1380 family transposase [Candidatus Cloacimonadota bacterium]
MKKKISKKFWQEKTIRTEFNSGTLTNYSGIFPIYQFMQKLDFFNLLEKKLDIPLHHNAKYTTGQIVSLVITGLFSGLNRINKFESYSRDTLVQNLLNLEGKVDEDTIGGRFKRFNQKYNNQFLDLMSVFSKKVHKKLQTDSDILDLDSTPKVVYGNQEGAKKGFNHTKKTAKCYHPLLSFLNSTKECLSIWLRPGNCYSSNNAVEYLRDVFCKLPSGIKELLVRADSGFFGDALISLIESRSNTFYLIKVKLKNLDSLLESRSDWLPVSGNPLMECCSFIYKCNSWEKERRFVALRSVKEHRTMTNGWIFEHYIYDYVCYVTNLDHSPNTIDRLYKKRGESENWIENVKNQLFGGTINVDNFWANEAFWICSVLAYNISVWFRKFTDLHCWRQEPSTFREWFVKLAGKVVHSGRKWYLKMYKAYHNKEEWLQMSYYLSELEFG